MSETNKLEQVVPVKKFVLPEISSKVKSWELLEDFATFLQERCQSYMRRNWKSLLLLLPPAPSTIKIATKLDPFIKVLAEKKGLKISVTRQGIYQDS